MSFWSSSAASAARESPLAFVGSSLMGSASLHHRPNSPNVTESAVPGCVLNHRSLACDVAWRDFPRSSGCSVKESKYYNCPRAIGNAHDLLVSLRVVAPLFAIFAHPRLRSRSTYPKPCRAGAFPDDAHQSLDIAIWVGAPTSAMLLWALSIIGRLSEPILRC